MLLGSLFQFGLAFHFLGRPDLRLPLIFQRLLSLRLLFLFLLLLPLQHHLRSLLIPLLLEHLPLLELLLTLPVVLLLLPQLLFVEASLLVIRRAGLARGLAGG
jgi:hypothetical protein